jgi:hypothetical protein
MKPAIISIPAGTADNFQNAGRPIVGKIPSMCGVDPILTIATTPNFFAS